MDSGHERVVITRQRSECSLEGMFISIINDKAVVDGALKGEIELHTILNGSIKFHETCKEIGECMTAMSKQHGYRNIENITLLPP